MITFAKDKATARISGEFYTNAINVMRGASSVSTYRGLPEQEAFDIEYWLLEEASCSACPNPRALQARSRWSPAVPVASARPPLNAFFAKAPVCCWPTSTRTHSGPPPTISPHVIPGTSCARDDGVTSEDAVADSFARAALEFGGVDILVSNAGIASSAPIEDTTLDLWNRNMSILSTGYFLVSREAFKVMKTQGVGGSIVFIGSKNGLAASPGASAYCTAKASELHLARCLALEGAPEGIRVNVVNPDAVLRGSKIWSGDWLKERAEAYGKDTSELEEHYRQRSLLKLSVLPEDIAEATYFSPLSFPPSRPGTSSTSTPATFRRSRGKRHIHKADLILRKREALSRRMGGILQTSGPSFETGLAASSG